MAIICLSGSLSFVHYCLIKARGFAHSGRTVFPLRRVSKEQTVSRSADCGYMSVGLRACDIYWCLYHNSICLRE